MAPSERDDLPTGLLAYVTLPEIPEPGVCDPFLYYAPTPNRPLNPAESTSMIAAKGPGLSEAATWRTTMAAIEFTNAAFDTLDTDPTLQAVHYRMGGAHA